MPGPQNRKLIRLFENHKGVYIPKPHNAIAETTTFDDDDDVAHAKAIAKAKELISSRGVDEAEIVEYTVKDLMDNEIPLLYVANADNTMMRYACYVYPNADQYDKLVQITINNMKNLRLRIYPY